MSIEKHIFTVLPGHFGFQVAFLHWTLIHADQHGTPAFLFGAGVSGRRREAPYVVSLLSFFSMGSVLEKSL